MDAAHALRAARRLAGLSQRELARRSGVAARTIAAIESGQAAPSWQTVTTLVAAAGLEPTLDRALPAPCAHLSRYLNLSTSERLYLSLGGTWQPRWDTGLPVWSQLARLARCRLPMLVDGIDAVGVWVPGTRVRFPLTVSLLADELPPVDVNVVALRTCTALPRGCVPVGVGSGGRLLVPSPDRLALDPSCAAHRWTLRASARLLHEHQGRDEALRRAAAHRDPDERRERERLLLTKAHRVHPRDQPSGLDSRAWRLDAPVSLRQWMREHRYPGAW